MKDFDLQAFQQYLMDGGLEQNLYALIAIGTFSVLVLIYLIRKSLRRDLAAQPLDEIPGDAQAARKPGSAAPMEPARPPARVDEIPGDTQAARKPGSAPPMEPARSPARVDEIPGDTQAARKPGLAAPMEPARPPARVDEIPGTAHGARQPGPESPVTPIRPKAPPPPPAEPAHIPQDSVLRRHYLHHVRYMLETVAAPRPTDSVLRRHYEHLLHSEFEACMRDPARIDQLLSDYAARRLADAAKAPEAPPVPAPAPIMGKPVDRPRAPTWVPEDSVLRRHFSAQVLFMLETVIFPRPTDSVLCRHYEHLIRSELEACLGDQARMDRLLSDYDACRTAEAI